MNHGSTDGQIVRRTRAGDTAAYEQLVQRHSARILAACHTQTASWQAAEELAQESFVRAFDQLHALKDPDRFAAWLAGIARRVCWDWVNSRKRQPRSLNHSATANGQPWSSSDDAPGEQLAAEEERQRLLAAVDQLPPRFREVILMYYYQDVTYEQLAATLGVSAATINARLSKARSMLRQRLSGARDAYPQSTK